MLFLSYSWGDSMAAHAIANAFRGAGHPVWLDVDDLDLTRQIEPQLCDAIARAAAVIHVDSPHSRRSQWVSLEREMASQHNTPLFDIPSEKLLRSIARLPPNNPWHTALGAMRFLYQCQ